MNTLPLPLPLPGRRRLVAFLLSAGLAAPAAALDVGASAPDLQLPGLKEPVRLAALKGKVVYVDFWASWCGPCKHSFPFMNEMQARYRSQGLEVVAVNLDAKREDAEQFLAQVPAQFTVAFDAQGESAKRFGVKGMPSSFLVGRDGRIVGQHKGFRDEDRQALEAQIAAALGAR